LVVYRFGSALIYGQHYVIEVFLPVAANILSRIARRVIAHPLIILEKIAIFLHAPTKILRPCISGSNK